LVYGAQQEMAFTSAHSELGTLYAEGDIDIGDIPARVSRNLLIRRAVVFEGARIPGAVADRKNAFVNVNVDFKLSQAQRDILKTHNLSIPDDSMFTVGTNNQLFQGFFRGFAASLEVMGISFEDAVELFMKPAVGSVFAVANHMSTASLNNGYFTALFARADSEGGYAAATTCSRLFFDPDDKFSADSLQVGGVLRNTRYTVSFLLALLVPIQLVRINNSIYLCQTHSFLCTINSGGGAFLQSHVRTIRRFYSARGNRNIHRCALLYISKNEQKI
jgi:hypothetical protein